MNITIVGAGNSGSAHAGMFAMDGHKVTIYEFIPNDNFRQLCKHPIIRVTYKDETCDPLLHRVTDDPSEAFEDAEIIFILTRTIAHPILAEKITPYLKDGQLVVIAPGYGGSLLFASKTAGKDIIYAEGESIPFDCRLQSPGHVDICFKNIRNPMGFYPANRSKEGLSRLKQLLDTYCLRKNIMESALSNPNLVVHTVGALMGLARIEHSHGDYWMYRESFTPSIMNLLYALDKERMDVLAKMNLPEMSFLDGFCYRTYEDQSVDSEIAFRNYAECGSPKGPDSAETRYLTEDVPIGLCLLSTLGKKFGLAMPVCDGIISIASAVAKCDYWQEARTIEKLGLADMSVVEILLGLKDGLDHYKGNAEL